jgi:S1-C subfamily serine protease
MDARVADLPVRLECIWEDGMNALEQLSDSLASAVQSAGESVVRVEGRRRLPSSGVLWADGDLLVTAHHTIERRREVRIGLPSGDTAEAKVLGRDPATDLALLRLPRRAGGPLAHAAADQVRVGHIALAVARPGESVQATMGIVSAVEGGWRSRFGGSLDRLIQSDVVMYPGFSGGALVDAWGRLIGMNTSGLLRGVSLAVPISTLSRVAGMLIEHGRVRRGYLGIGVQPAHLGTPHGSSGQVTGLLVASVEAGSPADRGGILLGDVLLSIGGNALATMDDLLSALAGDVVGAELPIELVRGGTVATARVTVGERAMPEEEEE